MPSNIEMMNPGDPSNMIGRKVRVFWPVDSSWYVGTVEQYDNTTGEHLLRYDDDDTEWVRVNEDNLIPQGPSTDRTAPTSEGETMHQAPPVSPAGLLIDQSNPAQVQTATRPVQPPPQTQSQQATVSPDHKWQGETPRRMGEPSGGPPGAPPPSGQKYVPHYTPNAGVVPIYAAHPHMAYPSAQPSYPGFHQGQPIPPHGHPPGMYGYSPVMMGGPPSMMSSPAVGEGSNQYPQPHPSLSGNKRKNGPKAWTKEEDALLLNLVQKMRIPMKWSVVAQSLPDRTGKQCRERYVNHLNPRLKVTDWTPIEDATIFHLYNTISSHWAKMSKMIPGRTDNGIKNRFHNLRRQLEREDEHRLRLSTARDFPEAIRLDRVREFPEQLREKAASLWDMKSGLSVLAAQSVVGDHNASRNAGRFGPFRAGEPGDMCVRCGFLVPSVHTGDEICTKTGWCQSCARIPPHVCGNMLRECLNLRRCQDAEKRKIIEAWTDSIPIGEKSEERNVLLASG